MSNLHQSYRDVFVVNNPALFTDGFSDQLGVGEIGFFLYDPNKDQVAIVPNYAIHKAFQLIQGTPELPTSLLSAVANESKKSKPIKGKNILEFTGKKAEHGQNQIIALGYDGVDVTKTISAKCEESKTVFIKLSGSPIDQTFHTDGKGYVRQYSLNSGCCDDCGDDCAQISAETLADDLVRQINEDPILSLSNPIVSAAPNAQKPSNKLIKAKKVLGVAAPVADATCQEYLLSVCDEGNDVALGRVQSQYPGQTIIRKDRANSTSVYSLTEDSEADAPDDFTNDGLVLVNDCLTCADGYTSVPAGFAYKILRQDAGNGGAITTLASNYSVASSGITRVAYQFGQSTYLVVTSQDTLTPSGTDIVVPLGVTRNSCVLTDDTPIAWTEGAVLNKFNRVYTISLADNLCGASRLAELQVAYPLLVIAEDTVGECVRIYTTTILSACTAQNCFPDAPSWTSPEPYQGTKWTGAVLPAADVSTPVGVVIESVWIDRIVAEEAYKFWDYEAEPITIEISQHSHDYNDKPTLCVTEWPVTELQANKIPSGVGSRVREEEAFFKGYERKYRDDCNPISRQLQDAVLQADPTKFYDLYRLKFRFDYHQSWFSQQEHDYYTLEVYFQEGQGKAFENAVNAYVTAIGIDQEPVVLTAPLP